MDTGCYDLDYAKFRKSELSDLQETEVELLESLVLTIDKTVKTNVCVRCSKLMEEVTRVKDDIVYFTKPENSYTTGTLDRLARRFKDITRYVRTWDDYAKLFLEQHLRMAVLTVTRLVVRRKEIAELNSEISEVELNRQMELDRQLEGLHRIERAGERARNSPVLNPTLESSVDENIVDEDF